MYELDIPAVERSIFCGKNIIKQYFSIPKCRKTFLLTSNNYEIGYCEGECYLFTDKEDDIQETIKYIILCKKKPTEKMWRENSIVMLRWLKHPHLRTTTCDEVIHSWKDAFRYIEENSCSGIRGLRKPQIGALHAIMAHFTNAMEQGIVVLPTGTGKTETMLATLVATPCHKVLVVVPSDALRNQLAEKFLTLGFVKASGGMLSDTAATPIVGIVYEQFDSSEEFSYFVNQCNVIVSTINMISYLSENSDYQNVLKSEVSHLFIDEAHHSQAKTWKLLFALFDPNKILLFTATPFRNDKKILEGKFLYNYSLKRAQDDGYFKKINLSPVREYDKDKADNIIAQKAIAILRNDLLRGYDHIMMARCNNIKHAEKIFKYYHDMGSDLNPIVVHSKIKNKDRIIDNIKKKKHKILICVDMFGEGFDMPELKIAALHDARQSLAITLQTIGRFIRTGNETIGDASFIINIADPPAHEALEDLYANDADWNYLLPKITDEANQEELELKEFLSKFKDQNKRFISFQQINLPMSGYIYQIPESHLWRTDLWEDAVNKIDNFCYKYSDYSSNMLIIILGEQELIDWGKLNDIKNLNWNIIVLYKSVTTQTAFLYTTLLGMKIDKFASTILGDNIKRIIGHDVFKVFHDLKHLAIYNLGARRGGGRDISFQSFYGKYVQSGLSQIQQGRLQKNNVFGVGYRSGRKITMGCSVKGKIWSFLRGNIYSYSKWCDDIGSVVRNSNIDSNTFLEHTMEVEKRISLPSSTLIGINWPDDIWSRCDSDIVFSIQTGKITNWYDADLFIREIKDKNSIIFSLILGEDTYDYKFSIDTNGQSFHIENVSNTKINLKIGRSQYSFEEYLQENPVVFLYADHSEMCGNLYTKPLENSPAYSKDKIEVYDWDGVNINEESQGVSPFNELSIQYYTIQKLRNMYNIIYDDDGSGEIADIIGINEDKDCIYIDLYHLKFAIDNRVSNRIDNFYAVCGQAVKSIKWKYKVDDGKQAGIFKHLLCRHIKRKSQQKCSRIIKGDLNKIETLSRKAKFKKMVKFRIFIVQPGTSKEKVSDDILMLLGSTEQWLQEVANIPLNVVMSK